MNLALAAAFMAATPPKAFGADPRPITTASLIDEMTDVAGMAEFPSPGYTCKQFSSYDQKSKSPQDQTTEGWFANADAGQFLRVEERAGRKEHVMMDTAGPGAIVRIWSANPAGTVRIYLDGAAQPAVEAPMTDLLGANSAASPSPSVASTARAGTSTSRFPTPGAARSRATRAASITT